MYATTWCTCVLLTTVASLTAASASCRVDGDLCQRNSLLDISFDASRHVICGDTLTRAQTSDIPEVEFPPAHRGQKYLFAMLDPDAPGCSFLHALLIVTFQENGQMNTEKSLVEYRAPSPPHGTHRYQMYLYEWVGDDDSVNYVARSFSIAKLEDDNNLSQAVAVFQFRVPS